MILDTFIEELVIINDRLNDALGELSEEDRKVVDEGVSILKQALLYMLVVLTART